MPIYEYQCRKCSHKFEVLVRSKADAPTACPRCRAPSPAKQFSVFSTAAAGGGSDESPCDSCSCDSCPSSGCHLDED